ncbi:MAG: IS630 family transposase, partial [Gammaproteobacteria bacterium]|nr:IS630 family transposase [Gammaproteobacteria bacterium]
LIEHWFAELTNKAIRRNAFTSVAELITAIDEFVDANNVGKAARRPRGWTVMDDASIVKASRRP